MKNLLMLYLLFLSSQLLGQTSTFMEVAFMKPTEKKQSNQAHFNVLKNLVPVSVTTERNVQHNSLVQPFDGMEEFDKGSFTTHTLIEQLTELNSATPFSVSHNATLERFIRVYLKDRREYLNSLLGKSKYYFPVFESYLDKYDLPLELKYLAVVESALNPLAVSPSGAKGIWQFMYGTGTDYKLYIDSYVDERFDPVKSTEAACVYLKHLYTTFGDWDLALAAYNSGPGNVKKAIRRAGGNKNYWEIRQYLPRETSSYVPAFYATMYLFTYADFHHLKASKTDVAFVNSDTLHLKGSLNFKAIQRKTGIDLGLLKSLNPQYKKDVIPYVSGKTMVLALPTEKMVDFMKHETELYQIAVPHSINSSNGVIRVNKNNSYLVKNGDNLNSIATAHGISLQQLKTWNGLHTNFLIADQRLVVTDKKFLPQKTTELSDNYSFRKDSNKKNLVTYKVKHGDTLFKISKLFNNVPIDQLRTANNLQNVNYLKPGMKLIIQKPDKNDNI
ncbi:transglycosylase SLT domain-containing protein [Lutimonas sp.]|uniref:lytic transglycosylase domain-containing protein n=1 Tax=Lutimonas sp. TaxID=1872403 RepID=UPI003D9AEC2B